MNLKVLKRSRHTPQVGDIFAMLLSDDSYLFGRVVSTTANPLGVGDGVLIYVYATRAKEPIFPPETGVDNLLVPPMITNRLPWTAGYFLHIENRPATPRDVLPAHSFVDSRGWVFNEHGERLSNAAEPKGQWGLHSYRTIDDVLSRALGLPVSEEE